MRSSPPGLAAATAPEDGRGAPPAGPRLVILGRVIPVVPPNRRDPRLRVSAVILTIQVLGQTVLGFKVSIAQILVSIGLCALVEVVVTLARQGMVIWPASGLLTGNGVAFILRASGTRHGDWWTLHGIQYFVLAAMLSLLSKYLIRPGGRHLFNPSNFGVVWTLLVIGPKNVFPQYLWWGPLDRGWVLVALGVILAGGVWVLRPVRMAPMALAFLATFVPLVAVFAAAGRSFAAVWHSGPVSGLAYWSAICVSPELLIFVFFMMSDPQTAPRARSARVVYGAATAVIAAGLLLFQPTEFGIKLAILSSLTVVCALVPVIEALDRRRIGGAETTAAEGAPQLRRRRRWLAAVRNPAIAAAVIIAIAAPADTAALAHNRQLINIERGLTGTKNPQ
ncbi:MAG: RnfABCDGE type electron transport complex subunit D [Actinomycetota bacterium]|nr:RnfABCDGE type electron transport complex subunit D [Actinomycetota bacterium]